MIYAISKQGARKTLLQFRNWAELSEYTDHGCHAYAVTDEWARQWVLDGKDHETSLPGINDAPPAESFELYFPAALPVAWMRPIPPVDTPDGAGEWEVHFSYGSVAPVPVFGQTWTPLFERPRAVEWRSVETAPRDGRDLIMTSKDWNGDVIVASYAFDAWREHPNPESVRFEPTHWIPIPIFDLEEGR